MAATEQAKHTPRWSVGPRQDATCTISGFRPVGTLSVAAPIAYVVEGDEAGLIAAAPDMAEALEPFANLASIIRPDLPDDTVIQIKLGEHVIHHLALGSLRAARAALSKAGA